MIVSSIPWMDDGTPPNRKKKKFLPFPFSPSPQNPKKGKKFSLFPSPQNPKKGKIDCTDCRPSLPQCLPEIFIMGQYPFITGWIPIVL